MGGWDCSFIPVNNGHEKEHQLGLLKTDMLAESARTFLNFYLVEPHLFQDPRGLRKKGASLKWPKWNVTPSTNKQK